MSDYLFVVRSLNPVGGSEGVAAWMLEALLERGSVTVLTETSGDLAALDRSFGTRLLGKDFSVIEARPAWIDFLARIGIPHQLLRFRAFLAAARREMKRHRLCISAYNDLDLGADKPCLQYMHGPPCNQSELLHRLNLEERSPLGRLLAWLNITLCNLFVPWNDRHARANWTVANSSWTSLQFATYYGRTADRVVFPPPLGEAFELDGRPRRPSFVAMGRAHREKGWFDAIAIVERLRQKGHDVGLEIFLLPSDPTLLESLERLASRHHDWLTIRIDAPRSEIDATIANSAYGLHTSNAESYGMAVAELVLGGCLTAVRDIGGQVEIVTEPDLRFTDVDDAVAKLDHLLLSPALQTRLRKSQEARRPLYSRTAFLDTFRACLDEFESRAMNELGGALR